MTWRWEPGRKGTGYRKLLLARGRSWDAYVIDYPPGSHVPRHRDPVPGRRHYRLNVVLLGEDAFRGEALARIGRAALFRPDAVEHEVARVSRRRVVLSIGVAL